MGELQIEGIYPLAYIRMLTGADVRRVFARTARHFHQVNVDNDVEDLGTLTLEMERGLVGTLCIGRIGKASHPDIGEIKLHVLGERGGLVISEARPEVAVYYRGQPAGRVPPSPPGDRQRLPAAGQFRPRHRDRRRDDPRRPRQPRDLCHGRSCASSARTGRCVTVS